MRNLTSLIVIALMLSLSITAEAKKKPPVPTGPCTAPTCKEMKHKLKKARSSSYRSGRKLLEMRAKSDGYASGILAGKAQAQAQAEAETRGYTAGLKDSRVNATKETATSQLNVLTPASVPAVPAERLIPEEKGKDTKTAPAKTKKPDLDPTSICGKYGVKRIDHGADFKQGGEKAKLRVICNDPTPAVDPMVSQVVAKEIRKSSKMHIGWKLLIGVGTTGAMAAAGWGIGDEVNPAEYNQATGDYSTGSGGAGAVIGLASGAVINATWILLTELL